MLGLVDLGQRGDQRFAFHVHDRNIVGAGEQEHEVVLASFVRTLDAQHFTAIVLSRLLAKPSRPRRAPTYAALPSPKSLTVMAGAPSKPVHLSALKEATT